MTLETQIIGGKNILTLLTMNDKNFIIIADFIENII